MCCSSQVYKLIQCVCVKPFILFYSWTNKLFVTPSRLMMLTGASLLGTCGFISGIIAILHWRDKVRVLSSIFNLKSLFWRIKIISQFTILFRVVMNCRSRYELQESFWTAGVLMNCRSRYELQESLWTAGVVMNCRNIYFDKWRLLFKFFVL